MMLMRNCCLLLCAMLLVACGGTPQKSVSTPVSNQPQIIPDEKPTLNQLLAIAASKKEPYAELVEVTRQLADTNCVKAIKVAELLMTLPQTAAFTNQLMFLGGRCLLQLQRLVEAKDWIERLPDNQDWLHRKHDLLHTIYKQENSWWLAANSYYYKAQPSLETELAIWDLLAKLPSKELQIRSTEISNITHLATLMIIQRRLTHDSESARNALQQWLTDNPAHVFHEELPESLKFAVSNAMIKGHNIAVLLPLSGPRKAQGEAVKEGILAASFSHSSEARNVTFINTDTWSSTSLPELHQFDLILGPLLKQNIDLIRPHIPQGIPILNLNRTEPDPTRENHFYFSLAPEDEARQLAESLLQQGYTSPFVIANKSSTYQRMKNVFIESWTTGSSPETLDFSETKTLRKGVNQTLSLTDSKARIDQIRRLLKPQLQATERNRRDIDVIIVFANTTHTELINPLIEASISPFSDIIPVYASSRSHSRYHSKNDLRDLRNLHFIDMPWMLPSTEYRWLQNFSSELWPERRDNLNRLFAMGYDAINVVPYLRLLKTLPNQTWRGLTGELTVDNYGQTNRVSKWAQFTEERVVSIELH